MKDLISLLLSDINGIYIPKIFTKDFKKSFVNKAIPDKEDRKILRAGPENEWYWNAWDFILDKSFFWNRQEYCLFQDGDLFLINLTELNKLSEEDQENFWGNLTH